MNISRVSNVNFGKIHLSANLKEDIVKNRPGADDIQKDTEYRSKVERLQQKLNTENNGNHELYVDKFVKEGYHIDAHEAWTDGGYGWHVDEMDEPDKYTFSLYLKGKHTNVYVGRLVEEGILPYVPNILDKILEVLDKKDIDADEKQLIKKDIKWVEDEKQRQIEEKKRQEELDKIWEEKRKIELEKQQKILEAQNQLESNNKFFTDFMA